MKWKRILQNLALVIASFAIAVAGIFILGEAYFRMKFQAEIAGPPRSMSSFHAERGWALNPGTYPYINIAAFRDVVVNINDYGIRHGDLSLPTVPSRRRVTIVGDSFLFAAALNIEQSIAGQLQERLGSEFEVVPLAVEGYGTGQQILFLEELIGKGYDVGEYLVFVAFTNDILDNVGLDYTGSGTRDPLKPVFSVADSTLNFLPPDYHPEADGGRTGFQGPELDSLFYRFLVHRGEVLASTYPSIFSIADRLGLVPELSRRPAIISAWYDDSWESNWAVTESLFRWSASRYHRPPATRVVIAYVPSPFQVSAMFRDMLGSGQDADEETRGFLADDRRPQRLLAELSAGLGLQMVDATDALIEESATTPVYFAREGHLNEDGARVVGAAIADTLLASGQE